MFDDGQDTLWQDMRHEMLSKRSFQVYPSLSLPMSIRFQVQAMLCGGLHGFSENCCS